MEIQRGEPGGYSTGAEMALEMLQTGKGATAVLAGQGFAMRLFLLDLDRILVVHGGEHSQTDRQGRGKNLRLSSGEICGDEGGVM